jgi:PTH1 family peptidyl-tRNA hydrolase
VTDGRWLVAGLGNPPAEYAGTRHNIGAELVEHLAADAGSALARNRRAGCRTAEVRIAGAPVVLAVPESFMNVSGGPVQRAAGWYRVPIERIVVCHDDLDLPLGELRLKRGGGHGGHNGLKDLDRAFGGPGYLRVRIGVGRPPGSTVAADHVLRPFAAEERDAVATVLATAADAVAALIADGLETAQNRFHGRRASGAGPGADPGDAVRHEEDR